MPERTDARPLFIRFIVSTGLRVDALVRSFGRVEFRVDKIEGGVPGSRSRVDTQIGRSALLSKVRGSSEQAEYKDERERRRGREKKGRRRHDTEHKSARRHGKASEVEVEILKEAEI